MKKLKNFLFAIIALAVFFILAEALLRQSGFCFYPADLRNIPVQSQPFCIRQRGYYITNSKYNGIFLTQSFPAAKKSFRIFVFGGSSINYLGKMDYLGERLKERWPARNFEIINFGGLSYGPSRLLPIFRESLNYRPDLIIIYSGHNEFEEELLKAQGAKNWAGRLNEKLLALRFYQLLSKGYARWKYHQLALYRRRHPQAQVSEFCPQAKVDWELVFDDDKKRLRYGNYRRNIEAMAQMAGRTGVTLMLCTVAYNRLGVPPFYSRQYGSSYIDFKRHLTEQKIEQYLQGGNPDAFMEYAAGQALYEQGDYPAAKKHLEEAFILDGRPHRANNEINAIIKQAAAKYNLLLIDVDAAVCAASVGQIPSSELFSDHCHLNPQGQKILMDEVFKWYNKFLIEKNESSRR